MTPAVRFRPGAPGVYPVPVVPTPSLAGARMDVAAFVGVAPRGPARVPVVDESWPADRAPLLHPARPRRRTVPIAVESFDAYRRTFGGFEGPGLLPYAVASFFAQGGRRAYIARVVHDSAAGPLPPGKPAAPASGEVPWGAGSFRLIARNEGAWGNALRAAFGVARRAVAFEKLHASVTGFTLPPDADLPDGSVVLVRDAAGFRDLRTVAVWSERLPKARGSVLRVEFDAPLAFVPAAVEVVEGELLIDDGGREERHTRLGLTPHHPRWAVRVLDAESELAYPDPPSVAFVPAQLDLTRTAELAPVDPDAPPQFAGGEDAYPHVTPDDFFDGRWVLGDDEPGDGVHCLVHLPDLSLVCVPDLYSPEPLAPRDDVTDPVSLAGAEFARCVRVPPRTASPIESADLDGLRLDPRQPADLEKIVGYQRRLEDLAESLRSFVVLLDAPPHLTHSRLVRWRGNFGSAFVAAYHPWVAEARPDDARDALIRVPPSAAAAGVIAATELRFGVPHGPANVLVAGAVDVAEVVSAARHDELHQLGVNVFLRDRDGVRLTAARTLSRDASYRQLSVRRLMTQLARTLDREMQWAVFEPNNAGLRADVQRALAAFLRRLFRGGAFRGATEEEAFFVRVDESRQRADAGQFVAEVGVAPAEPLEFILLRLVGDADGLTISEG